jgi:hypothetical protein
VFVRRLPGVDNSPTSAGHMTPDLLHGLIEAARAVASSGTLEPWLDKKNLAENYASRRERKLS